MAKEDIAQNGDKPVTRRECAERHEASLQEAKRASEAAKESARKAEKWTKGVGLALGILNMFVAGLLTWNISTASSASSRANAAEMRVEGLATIRELADETIVQRLDKLEDKVDRLLELSVKHETKERGGAQ